MKDMTELLKAARARRGLSLREASRICGVPVATLSKLENGKLANPTLVTMVAMQKAYGIPLITWIDTPLNKREKKS